MQSGNLAPHLILLMLMPILTDNDEVPQETFIVGVTQIVADQGYGKVIDLNIERGLSQIRYPRSVEKEVLFARISRWADNYDEVQMHSNIWKEDRGFRTNSIIYASEDYTSFAVAALVYSPDTKTMVIFFQFGII